MLSLGIDTSNYTSSAALADEEGNIIADNRRLLQTKPGEKGLRQSDALFQHWNELPGLLSPLLKEHGRDIGSVTVSSRPRPQEGSYMPVFLAGLSAGRMISDSLGVPLFESTHQEGHLAAAAFGNPVDFSKKLLFAHLSGGTLEVLKLEEGRFTIAASTADISYGQLLDRAAVFMGLPFPGGRYIDEMALSADVSGKKNPFARIYKGGLKLNLSGLENQFKDNYEKYEKEELSAFLMERISESFIQVMDDIAAAEGADQILVCGGVASSSYLRRRCEGRGYMFGRAELCSDNAVGLALIGGKAPWH
ncbi:MAG: hypothetical protein II971_00605 [Firmicutes bacterium]|nr:hypothetical protein [Bacillota bacterium]